ncbi:alpha/beta hydrolase [Pseudohoeflea suaedae]|uniref:Alpha/beta hydrolase n=1 Tax=Pseudohoeflea suaedae TaxID=877384 RepID=A0A4R5PJJ2_9HYPH|nr:alpha/beta hydrolase [Pseudohoeflea suaedae]TDH35841.1 alpha/beta hydrolase [Pseudohoeflea suaedae]
MTAPTQTEKATTADGYEDVFFSAPDGLKLHARDYGRAKPGTHDRFPLICLPGLSRNAADFHDIALKVAGDAEAPRRVVSFDYRGRGQSEWAKDPEDYNVMTEAEDVLAGMAALGIEHAIFLGTSRGGLIMHVLAATRPGVIAAGILNDIGPVIEGTGLAQIKTYLTRATRPISFSDAARVQKEVHGKAFPALQDDDWLDFAHAIYVEDKKKRLVGNYDPKLLTPLKNMDFSSPLPTMWPQFEALAAKRPLLVIRGENSSLLSEDTVSEMQGLAPHIETHTALGQGHAPILHLGSLPGLIRNFLDRCDRRFTHPAG